MRSIQTPRPLFFFPPRRRGLPRIGLYLLISSPGDASSDPSSLPCVFISRAGDPCLDCAETVISCPAYAPPGPTQASSVPHNRLGSHDSESPRLDVNQTPASYATSKTAGAGELTNGT